MIRSVMIFLAVVILLATNVWSADENLPYLGEKQILCVVEFAPNSNDLDKTSRHAVDSALKSIQNINTDTHLIRIEGYARLDESESTILAINRAEAVEEFLRFAKGYYADRYLAGIVLKDGEVVSGVSPYRAEIVVYDNIFTAAGDPFKITSKESQ